MKHTPKRRRTAFTMLEIVFVIVITSLVAVAGGKAIVQILTNYTLQKEFAKIELDSASAIRQISGYLQNSIWDSIAIASGNAYTAMPFISSAEHGRIGKRNNANLAFIERNANATRGYFNANRNLPYFSGFIDVNLSGGATIVSQSNTDNLDALKAELQANGAIYFPFVNVGTNAYVGDKYYNNTDGGRNNTAIFPIKELHKNYTYINTAGEAVSTGRDSIELHSTPRQIGDVAMIVNRQPTILTIEDGSNGRYEEGDLTITPPQQQSILIAKKVSNLHIWTESSSSLIRIRICFEAGVTKSVMDEFCKEGIIMQ